MTSDEMSPFQQVYKAFHWTKYDELKGKDLTSTHGPPVALKICSLKVSKDKHDSLKQEQEVLAFLRGCPHPNLLFPIAIGETKDYTYLVSDLALGQPHVL